jgi:hypothetical protein
MWHRGKKRRLIMVAVSAIAFIFLAPYGCDLVVGNARMDLYGEVLDQMGRPAAGATVTFEAMRRSPVYFLTTVPMKGDEQKWRVQATTGADGRFALHAGRGRALFLKSIDGTSYTQACLFLAFDYGRDPPEPAYQPDPARPVVLLDGITGRVRFQ